MKKIRFLNALFIIIFLCLGLSPSKNVFAEEVSIYTEIPNEVRTISNKKFIREVQEIRKNFSTAAYRYVEKNYIPCCQLLNEDEDYVSTDYENMTLAEPLFLCNSTSEEQIESYLYPIILGKKIIAVAQVTKSDSDWNIMINKYYVELLNQLNYAENSNWLFSSDGTHIEAFNDKKTIYQRT